MKKNTLASILKKAELISKAVEEEAEEILEDTEMAVKAICKASDQPKVLRRIEKALEDEGVEAVFQKKVSKVALKKTAEVEPMSEEEVKELVNNVVDAVVSEFEETLKDADDVCEETLKEVFEEDEESMEPEEMQQLEARLKRTIERKLASNGIYSRMSRNHVAKKPAKVDKKASKAKQAENILKQYRKARKSK